MVVPVAQKLSKFFSNFKRYRYKKSEIILRGGDTPQGVYFINKGYVRDYSISREGEEMTLIIFKPGDFFPITWVFNDRHNLHYFEAMSVVELWRCPKNDFITFIKANPEVFFELTSHIVLRLGGIMQRIEYLAFGNAYQKIASILMICAERFGRKKNKSILITVPLTHKDLAMLVGMTRETVSIEVKKLERKRIIRYRKRLIIVIDIKKLLIASSVDEQTDIMR